VNTRARPPREGRPQLTVSARSTALARARCPEASGWSPSAASNEVSSTVPCSFTGVYAWWAAAPRRVHGAGEGVAGGGIGRVEGGADRAAEVVGPTGDGHRGGLCQRVRHGRVAQLLEWDADGQAAHGGIGQGGGVLGWRPRRRPLLVRGVTEHHPVAPAPRWCRRGRRRWWRSAGAATVGARWAAATAGTVAPAARRMTTLQRRLLLRCWGGACAPAVRVGGLPPSPAAVTSLRSHGRAAGASRWRLYQRRRVGRSPPGQELTWPPERARTTLRSVRLWLVGPGSTNHDRLRSPEPAGPAHAPVQTAAHGWDGTTDSAGRTHPLDTAWLTAGEPHKLTVVSPPTTPARGHS